jgi:hypothetical protein
MCLLYINVYCGAIQASSGKETSVSVLTPCQNKGQIYTLSSTLGGGGIQVEFICELPIHSEVKEDEDSPKWCSP